MPHIFVEEHELDLLKRAVIKWLDTIEGNSVYSADDEATASEAVNIVTGQLQGVLAQIDGAED